MTIALDTSIELARWYDEDAKLHKITIQKYLDLVDAKNQKEIAEFLNERLFSRYLKPFLFSDSKYRTQYKNGFSIMANCCLLIETLQSFKNGWGDSNRQSAEAFRQFLKDEAGFNAFKGKENEFYQHVRCGILHQGEITGGWTINRDGKSVIFDSKTLKIDSVSFAKELKKSLKSYSSKLETEKWDSEIWDNFRTKMRKIIANCEK